MERIRILEIPNRQSNRKKFKTEENISQKYEKGIITNNENHNNDVDLSSDPLEEYNSEVESYDYQDDCDMKTLTEDYKSKDKILRKTMCNIVLTKNVPKDVTESFLKMLSNYGIEVPQTKAALLSEFQRPNEANLSHQYTELKIQMAKMEATLEQIKRAVLIPKSSMRDICVAIPIQTEADLELLNNQCAENDLTAHFEKFKYLTDIIDESVLLKYNWDGVQGKKKLSEYRSLHQTLFEAFENETIKDFPLYLKFIKGELRRVHNKHHQKLSRKRRSQNIYSNEEIMVFSEQILS